MASNLLTTKCKCGHEFTTRDIQSKLVNMEIVKGYYDPNFYGGNVKKFAEAKCTCGKLYWLYLTENNGLLSVKDIELREEENTTNVSNANSNLSKMKRSELFKLSKALGLSASFSVKNDELIKMIEKARRQ